MRRLPPLRKLSFSGLCENFEDMTVAHIDASLPDHTDTTSVYHPHRNFWLHYRADGSFLQLRRPLVCLLSIDISGCVSPEWEERHVSAMAQE